MERLGRVFPLQPGTGPSGEPSQQRASCHAEQVIGMRLMVEGDLSHKKAEDAAEDDQSQGDQRHALTIL